MSVFICVSVDKYTHFECKRQGYNALIGGIMKGIGKRLKELRQVLGLSQKEFGERIGRSWRAIQNYEAEQRVPDETTLKLIEVLFNVNPEWLREGKGKPFFEEVGRLSPKWPVYEKRMREKLMELAREIVDGHIEHLYSKEEISKLSEPFKELLYRTALNILSGAYQSLSFTLERCIDWYLGKHPLRKLEDKMRTSQTQNDGAPGEE